MLCHSLMSLKSIMKVTEVEFYGVLLWGMEKQRESKGGRPLSEEQKYELEELLNQYPQVFKEPKTLLSRREIKHAIIVRPEK